MATAPRPADGGWLVRAFWVLAIALLGLQVVIYSRATSFPHSLNYVEGYTIDEALRLGRHQAVYRDVATAPYFPTVYPPLYLALLAPVLRAVGPAFWPGRVLSLLAYVCVCGLAGVVIARGGSRRAGLAGAAVLLAAPVFHPWAALNKPDLLAIALGYAGLTAATARPARSEIVAGVCFASAIWTKQNAVAGLVTVVLLLATRRDWRHLARIAVVTALLLVVPGLCLERATDGWFLRQVVQSHLIDWSLGRVGLLLKDVVLFQPLLLAAGLWAAIGAARRRILDETTLFLAVAALVSLAAGKNGSDRNYFMEPLLAMVVVACRHLEPPAVWGRGARAVAGLALVLQVGLFVLGDLHRDRLTSASRHALDQAVAMVAATPGDVIADDAGLLTSTGKAVWLEPFIMAEMSRAGAWDQSPLLADLEQRRFALLLIQVKPDGIVEARYTREMVGAIRRCYRHKATFASLATVTAIYEPAPASGP